MRYRRSRSVWRLESDLATEGFDASLDTSVSAAQCGSIEIKREIDTGRITPALLVRAPTPLKSIGPNSTTLSTRGNRVIAAGYQGGPTGPCTSTPLNNAT